MRIPRDGVGRRDGCPPHLRMTFASRTSTGAVVAEGTTSTRCARRSRPRLRAELAAAHPELERRGLTAWTSATLPREVDAAAAPGGRPRLPGARRRGRRRSACACSRRRRRRRDAMRAGTRRLLLLTVPSPLRHVARPAARATPQLALAGAPHGGVARRARRRARPRRIDALVAEAGGPAWDEAGFARLRDHVAGELADRTTAVVARRSRGSSTPRATSAAGSSRCTARRCRARAPRRRAPARPAGPPGLRRPRTGAARLPDVERYLHAAARRLERLPDDAGRRPRPDARRSTSSRRLPAARRRLARGPPAARRRCARSRGCSRSCGSASSPRASGRAGQVSAKRIRRTLEEAAIAPR